MYISLIAFILLLFSSFIQLPIEKGNFKKSDLVELSKVDTTFRFDIRYATTNNFAGQPVYKEARAFLQQPAAECLKEAHEELKSMGYGLLIFDAYRPWSVTKLFWDITPAKNKMYVAKPSKGSRHNRGCAIDLSLYDLKTGKEIEMTGAYDEMSARSHRSYTGGTLEQRKNRDLLIKVMRSYGFSVHRYEWWHFDYMDWRNYAIQDILFTDL